MRPQLLACALGLGVLCVGGVLLLHRQLPSQPTEQGSLLKLVHHTRRLDAKLDTLARAIDAIQTKLEQPELWERPESEVDDSRAKPASMMRGELEELRRKIALLEASTPHEQPIQDVVMQREGSNGLSKKSERVADAGIARAKDAVAAEATLREKCPDRRPIHGLLTAQASVYQQWQARIMYYHWEKQKAIAGECTDMAGFTRLTATAGGKPDGLEREIPSVFVEELSEEVMKSHFHFGVLNRPHSILKLLSSPEILEQLTSSFVVILETDHILMKPLSNLATDTMPAGWVFGYMHGNKGQDSIVHKYWPEGSGSMLDPVGPSPLIIHLSQLRQVAQRWMDFSLSLRSDKSAESVMQGWVQEMWGYTIAAASLGIKHRLVREMQVRCTLSPNRIQVDFVLTLTISRLKLHLSLPMCPPTSRAKRTSFTTRTASSTRLTAGHRA